MDIQGFQLLKLTWTYNNTCNETGLSPQKSLKRRRYCILFGIDWPMRCERPCSPISATTLLTYYPYCVSDLND
jgi:hypothetical protein